MVRTLEQMNRRRSELTFDNPTSCSYNPCRFAVSRASNSLETRSLTMKKIIASAGMVAVGASSLYAVNYGDLSADQTSKRWSVSAAVRGFYDDNYTTRPSGPQKRDSLGFEVSPSASYNMPMETSFLGLSYVYTMAYFADRDENKIDQTHDVRLNFDHRFSEQYHLNFTDQFVYSFEPTLLDQGATVTTPLRLDAEGLHNRAVLSVDAQLTPVWSVLGGYENNFYDYQDSGDGSYSALLDRMEHLFRGDLRYTLSPNTTAFLGYQFGINDYRSTDYLSIFSPLRGEDRSSTSHYGYVGAEHKFSSMLSVEGRAGIQFVDYSELNQNDTSPYIDVIGTYNYLPGSYLKLGLRQAHNGTDVAGAATSADDVTLDQNTTTVYLSVNHRITALVTASSLLQYQHSIYNGGAVDGEADDYISLGLSLAYKLNRNWSVEASYYLDNLSSDISGREFTRNRIMAGVRGTY